MDDASKRSAPTLLMGTPEPSLPHDARSPQPAPSPSAAAHPAPKPRANDRRTIRGAVDAGTPAPMRAPVATAQTPSVVIDDPELAAPDRVGTPPVDELTRPVFTAFSLPPLPAAPARAFRESAAPERAAPGASPWRWAAAVLACVGLLFAALAMRRPPSAPTFAHAPVPAPASTPANVSLIYDASTPPR